MVELAQAGVTLRPTAVQVLGNPSADKLAAWRLTEALRAAGCDVDLEFVAGAGHSDSEPGLVDAMVRATDRFRDVLGE